MHCCCFRPYECIVAQPVSSLRERLGAYVVIA